MASKKLKKLLKGAALVGAAGLGAAALGRKRRNQANVELDLPISRIDGRNFGPYKKSPSFIKNKMMTAKDMAQDPFFVNAETLMNDSRMFRKGGRVGCGVAKKGFGKAMKKGKK